MPSSRCWNLVVAVGHLAEGTVICSQVPLRIPPSTGSQGPAGTGLLRLAAVPGVWCLGQLLWCGQNRQRASAKR